MKKNFNHDRGLKAYVDRYERVHSEELLQKINKYMCCVIRGICEVYQILLPGCIHFEQLVF